MQQLNPFEIKAEISKILSALEDVKDFDNYEVHYRLLDAQEDKSVISKLLLKEINHDNSELIKYLLLRYSRKDELVENLWSIIKNKFTTNKAKIFALDLLRDIDSNWSYEDCNQYLDNPDEFLDEDTRKILDKAIINPEVQIDFLDFLSSLPQSDKMTLLNSLSNDFSKDELANILIPVFLSSPDSEYGKKALEILGNSKSQLAYHALNSALNYAPENLQPSIKKNISVLKLAGIREDNSKEFYKKLLIHSKPYKFCTTYPDGHGNQAVIFSRINDNTQRVQFVAVVIDDYKGIRDCFGFNNISPIECNTIIDKFYKGQAAVELSPEVIKGILDNAESKSTSGIPYEYVCWKNLLADIDFCDCKIDYDVKTLSDNEFENILKSDFTDFWFLNEGYSDEFDDFLNLANQTEAEDFDKIIDENLEKVFFDSEYKIWSERILTAAKLKHFTGDKKDAQNLYSLYNDEKLTKELFKNILRKSLYEYYFAKQDDKKVSQIENMWVN